jgi:hypothetical protein
MAVAGVGGSLNSSLSDEQMRRPLSIALISLLGAVLAVPTAQAATRRYDFQGGFLPQLRIQVAVFYKNKQRHGTYTPRQAIYSATVGVNCDPPISTATAPTGSNIFGSLDYTRIKMRKGSFTYSYSSQIFTGAAPGNISATATGKMITKKSKLTKHLRVDGSVSVLAYNDPTLGLHNCFSAMPVSYSASACRYHDSPPYINQSLPFCSAAQIGVPQPEPCDATGHRSPTDRIARGVASAGTDPAPRCG